MNDERELDGGLFPPSVGEPPRGHILTINADDSCSVDCPGVTDRCRLWMACICWMPGEKFAGDPGIQAAVETLSDYEAHGERHEWNNDRSDYCTPTNDCWIAYFFTNTDYVAEWRELRCPVAGTYAVDLDSGEDSWPYVVDVIALAGDA